jgi:hypothetical protein
MTRIGTIALAASALWWTAAPARRRKTLARPASRRNPLNRSLLASRRQTRSTSPSSGGGEIDVSNEPSGSVPRSRHNDSFYLRVAFGLGWLGADFGGNSARGASAEAERGSFALTMIGGSPIAARDRHCSARDVQVSTGTMGADR